MLDRGAAGQHLVQGGAQKTIWSREQMANKVRSVIRRPFVPPLF